MEGIGPLASAAGYRLIRRDSVSSTMDEAAMLARAGETGRVWVMAEKQTGGRGRQGRTWISETGNFYATLLLRDPCPTMHAPQIGFVAGLALRDAILSLAPLDERVRLKWPNDVLIDGAKAAGVLLEGFTLAGDGEARGFAVLVGVGVNVEHHPTGLAYATCDLAQFGFRGKPLDLMRALSDAFARRFERWRGDGFGALRPDWLAAAAGRGDTIAVQLQDRRVSGVFAGIDGDGRLILETEAGSQIIDAGDVTLRGRAA